MTSVEELELVDTLLKGVLKLTKLNVECQQFMCSTLRQSIDAQQNICAQLKQLYKTQRRQIVASAKSQRKDTEIAMMASTRRHLQSGKGEDECVLHPKAIGSAQHSERDIAAAVKKAKKLMPQLNAQLKASRKPTLQSVASVMAAIRHKPAAHSSEPIEIDSSDGCDEHFEEKGTGIVQLPQTFAASKQSVGAQKENDIELLPSETRDATVELATDKHTEECNQQESGGLLVDGSSDKAQRRVESREAIAEKPYSLLDEIGEPVPGSTQESSLQLLEEIGDVKNGDALDAVFDGSRMDAHSFELKSATKTLPQMFRNMRLQSDKKTVTESKATVTAETKQQSATESQRISDATMNSAANGIVTAEDSSRKETSASEWLSEMGALSAKKKTKKKSPGGGRKKATTYPSLFGAKTKEESGAKKRVGKRKGKQSGYSVFVSETAKTLKQVSSASKSEESQKINFSKTVGEMWKGLSEAQKQEFKEKAKFLNALKQKQSEDMTETPKSVSGKKRKKCSTQTAESETKENGPVKKKRRKRKKKKKAAESELLEPKRRHKRHGKHRGKRKHKRDKDLSKMQLKAFLSDGSEELTGDSSEDGKRDSESKEADGDWDADCSVAPKTRSEMAKTGRLSSVFRNVSCTRMFESSPTSTPLTADSSLTPPPTTIGGLISAKDSSASDSQQRRLVAVRSGVSVEVNSDELSSMLDSDFDIASAELSSDDSSSDSHHSANDGFHVEIVRTVDNSLWAKQNASDKKLLCKYQKFRGTQK